MNILLLNQDWFADEWRAAGHRVHSAGLNPGLEIPLETPCIHIDGIIDRMPDGFKPDRIVFFDNSSPVVFSGLDETDIPILFYSVDTHHHYELHHFLYDVFDETLVAQRDYIPYFEQFGQNPEWFPLWASRVVEPSYNEKKYGAVFVGNIVSDLNPERKVFFEALQKEVEMLCTQGAYWEIFPYAEIVINQTVKSDLNFRVFEAMMCGSLLLTEHSGNGLHDLFQAEKHFAMYIKNDVKEAAEKIRYYLARPEEARAIAKAGRDEIMARHLPQHRAAAMLEKVIKLEKKHSPTKHFGMMCNFVILAQRVRQKELDSPVQQQTLIYALRSAEMAFTRREPLDESMALFAVTGCVLFDIVSRGVSGKQLLLRLCEQYPHIKALQYGRIRILLNEGKVNDARSLAREISPLDPEDAFQKVEELIATLVQ